MTGPTAVVWPVRRQMPDLSTLDETTGLKVATAVEMLRARKDAYGDEFLRVAREHLPGYRGLPDDEIRVSAQRFMDTVVAELSCLRIPDEALRGLVQAFAARSAARGIAPDLLAAGYQLGSRLMLGMLDEVGAEVGLPPDLVLAIHDSTWEFSNEASAVFARVHHDLALERAQFDAERRSTYAGGVLRGTFAAGQVNRDAYLFGLDPRVRHVPLAARAVSTGDADTIRRAIASALHLPADRLLFAEVGASLGFIAPQAPDHLTGHLVAAGPAVPLDQLHAAFAEAVLALDTAERFGQSGVVRLADLGPRPLVLTGGQIVAGLVARHLDALVGSGRANRDIAETTRIYLDCDQQVRDTAHRLAVHPNTVRYRVHRFTELTGLDLRRTEDLITAWWLLHQDRPAPA